MSAITFPLNPDEGQIETINGITWIWDGSSWSKLFKGWNLNADSDLYYTEGNIGIGTDDPSNLLSLAKASTTIYDPLNIGYGTDDGTLLRIENNDTTDGPSYAGMLLQSSGASVNVSQTIIGSVNTPHPDTGGWSGSYGKFFIGVRGSNFGDVIERFCIDSEGRVGIGKTSPSTNLEVANNSNSGSGAILRLSNISSAVDIGTSAGEIEFYKGDASGGIGVVGFIKSVAVDLGEKYNLVFGTGNVSNLTDRMTIDSSGYVGIGNSNPTSILELGPDPSPEITFNDSNAGDRGSLEFQDGDFKFYSNYNGTGRVSATDNGQLNLTIKKDGNIITDNGIGLTETYMGFVQGSNGIPGLPWWTEISTPDNYKGIYDSSDTLRSEVKVWSTNIDEHYNMSLGDYVEFDVPVNNAWRMNANGGPILVSLGGFWYAHDTNGAFEAKISFYTEEHIVNIDGVDVTIPAEWHESDDTITSVGTHKITVPLPQPNASNPPKLTKIRFTITDDPQTSNSNTWNVTVGCLRIFTSSPYGEQITLTQSGMGYFDKLEVEDEIKVNNSKVFHEGTEIPADVDLNDYRTTGFYVQTSINDTLTANAANWPVNKAGVLQVLNYENGGTGTPHHTVQMYHEYITSNVWTRYYYDSGSGGSWSGWVNLNTDLSGTGQWTESGSDIYYNTGNVGIGNTNPFATLEVNTKTIDGSIRIGNWEDVDQTNRYGKGTSIEFISDGDPHFAETDSPVIAASIKALYDKLDDDTDTFKSQNTALSFSTIFGKSGVSANFTEKMRISSDGKVGIGYHDPASPLHVVGSNSGDRLIALNLTNKHVNDSTQTAIRFSNSSDVDLLSAELASERQSDVSNDFWLKLRKDASTTPQVLTVKGATGNVGIGYHDPAHKLSVHFNEDNSDITDLRTINGIHLYNDDITGSRPKSAMLFRTPGSAIGWVGERISGDSMNLHLTTESNLGLTDDDGNPGPLGIPKVTFTNAGKVGIGTTSPLAPIHASVPSTSAGGTYVGLFENLSSQDSSQHGVKIIVEPTPNTGVGNYPLVISNDGDTTDSYCFLVRNDGRVDIGYTVGETKLSVAGAVGTQNGSESSPTHTFYSDSDTGAYRPAVNQYAISTGGSERIRVDENGLVGIGILPSYELHVRKDQNAKTNIALQNHDTGTSADSEIFIETKPGGGDPFVHFQIDGTETYTIGIDNSDSDKFKISDGYFGTSDRLTIDSSGNVGIGTSGPSAKLEISGDKDATNLIIGAPLHTVDGGGLADYSEILFDNNYVTGSSGTAYIRHYANSHQNYEGALYFGITSSTGTTSSALAIRGTGETISYNDIRISKSFPKLIIDSPSTSTTGDDWTTEGAMIVLGESADDGSGSGTAALYLTYNGNGNSYIGTGGVNSTTGIPNQGYINFPYNSNSVNIPSNVGIGTSASTTSYKLNMGGSIDMNNNNIDYVNQLHFQSNVRFYDESNDQFLTYKWGDTGTGGIRFVDGNSTLHGTIYGDGNAAFGLLSSTGEWGVRIVGNGQTQLYYDGAEKLKTQSTGVNITGTLNATDGLIRLGGDSFVDGVLKLKPKQITKVLTPFDPDYQDYFGYSVALSSDGSVLAVGSPYWDGSSGSSHGCVYIYDWNGYSWIQRGNVLTSVTSQSSSDHLGYSVSLSSDGSVLAVGVSGWDGVNDDDSSRGAVYIYDWTDTDSDGRSDSWIQRGDILHSDTGLGAVQDSDEFGENYGTHSFDSFGSSVSLSDDGTILAVGSSGWDSSAGPYGNGDQVGSVYIYDINGTSWSLRNIVHANTGNPNINQDYDTVHNYDNFGISTSLSSDGSILAVGAYQWDGPGGDGFLGENNGAVYIYDFDGNSWNLRGNVLTSGSDADKSDRFGRGVSLSSDGSVLVVGATHWDYVTDDDRGAVYIYDRSGDSWNLRGNSFYISDSGSENEGFGWSVTLSSDGSVLLVGAPYWDGSAPHQWYTGTDPFNPNKRGGVYTFSLEANSFPLSPSSSTKGYGLNVINDNIVLNSDVEVTGTLNATGLTSLNLPLSGETLTGVIDAGSSFTSAYRFNGRTFSWNSAMQAPTTHIPHIMQQTYAGWDPIMGIRTTNGFWQFGAYSNDTLHLGYMSGAFGSHSENSFDNSLAISPTAMTFSGYINATGGLKENGTALSLLYANKIHNHDAAYVTTNNFTTTVSNLVSTTSSQAWHETNPITINTISNGKKSIKFNYADGTSSDTIFTIGSFTAEQWDTSGNLNQHINYNTGNVGIGTTPSEANKLEVDGNVKLNGVTEAFGTHTSNLPSGSTIIFDASSNKLFRISSGTISGDWTIMVTNLNLEFREATNLTFVVESGTGTSHIPSTFKIGSLTQEVKWQGGSTPTGTVGTEPVDIYSFTVFCTATDTYTVLGNHVSFDK